MHHLWRRPPLTGAALRQFTPMDVVFSENNAASMPMSQPEAAMA
jgi:hypothetical protein